MPLISRSSALQFKRGATLATPAWQTRLEKFAAAEGNPAFAWQGPASLIALDGPNLVGAVWVYRGSDETDDFEDVAKFDILVASTHHGRGIGKQLFDFAVEAVEVAAEKWEIPVRVSVTSPQVERWLTATGWAKVAESPDDWISFWAP